VHYLAAPVEMRIYPSPPPGDTQRRSGGNQAYGNCPGYTDGIEENSEEAESSTDKGDYKVG
jgi:hypothetical protein